MSARPRPGRVRVLVVGVGNELLRDEGLGIHVARKLAANRDGLARGVEVAEAGLALLDVAPELARSDRVVLVDAVSAGREPGTVYRLDLGRGLACAWPREPHVSLHQWGLEDTLRAIGLMGMLPTRLTVIGAEPAVVEPGLELSPEAERAANRIVSELRVELGKGRRALRRRRTRRHTSSRA